MVDIEQLVEETQLYLDLDERFFDETEGSFIWDGAVVYFEKLPDWFILTVGGVEVTCARP